jgi:hypothetical protein
MSGEQQRVLRMLKDGKITVEEAEALLQALGEEEAAEPAGPAGPAPAGVAGPPPAGPERPGAGGPGPEQAPAEAGLEEPSAERRGEFRRMIEEILASVDVDGIVDTVRESLKRSRVDVERVKDEVRRAAERVRDETKKTAADYRRQRWGVSISRAIEGLWGLVDAAEAWSHDADMAPGSRLTIRNIWGDVRLADSTDGRLHVQAAKKAWGRDGTEARSMLDQIRITAEDEGQTFAVRVQPPVAGPARRFRVDFDVKVPGGVPVEVVEAKGDVVAAGLTGDLVIAVASGDAAVRQHGGSVDVDAAKGDVDIDDAAGNVRVKTRRGDVSLERVGGRAEVSVLSGDVTASGIGGEVDLRTLRGDVAVEEAAGRIAAASKNGDLSVRRPKGPVALDLHTTRGDVLAEVGYLIEGSASVLATISGDVTVRLDRSARCRIRARTASGEIRADAHLAEVHRGRRSLEGVAGGPDASLDLSTVSGDVVIEARR